MTVLIISQQHKDLPTLIRWGVRIAAARDEALAIQYLLKNDTQSTRKTLYIESNTENTEDKDTEDTDIPQSENTTHPVCKAVHSALESIKNSLDSEQQRSAVLALSPSLYLTGIGKTPALTAVLHCIDERKASLVLIPRQQHSRSEHDPERDLGRQLLRQAPCDTMLLRCSEGEQSQRRILLPVAGGPHALVALRLAAAVASNAEWEVHPLYIKSLGGPDPQAVGEHHLNAIIKKAGLTDHPCIKKRVVVHNNVRQAIADIAEEHYDLVMIGASDHNVVGRFLFGTISGHLFAQKSGMSISVLRRAYPLHERMHSFLKHLISKYLPQMSRDDRIDLFDKLESGSRCTTDFMMLMFFATVIAALGLIQNANAVIVGAMLVAPLMTPIIGAGLGLVQGNWVLVKTALRSIAIGFCVAFSAAFLIGLFSPLRSITEEMASRGEPNLLDLGIALASGLVGAYTMGRPNLSSALPGVAIAVALVPPIATVGISLAFGLFMNAQGALLLFLTNVVAVILGSAFMLYALGARAQESTSFVHTWMRRMIIILLFLLCVLSVPLTLFLIHK